VAILASLVAAFALTSPAFHAGGTIPARFTCDGANGRPPLRWTKLPSGTKALALRMTDPDAPGGTFVHWTAWGRKALTTSGKNTFGKVGYGGPCPPSGPAHRYVFRLYALRSPLPLRRGASPAAFTRALKGRVLAKATLVGRYRRP
jgi:Raf kinase inhibitor-like YbhB/YbcL family protein